MTRLHCLSGQIQLVQPRGHDPILWQREKSHGGGKPTLALDGQELELDPRDRSRLLRGATETLLLGIQRSTQTRQREQAIRAIPLTRQCSEFEYALPPVQQ